MVSEIQGNFLKAHEFAYSLQWIYLMASIVSIIFSLYILYSILVKKNFRTKKRWEKILFIPSMIVSIFFLLDILFAGDVSAKMSAEEHARWFGYSLCLGSKSIYEHGDHFFTADYKEKFYEKWKKEFRGMNKLDCGYIDQEGTYHSDFELVEYHHENREILGPEKCKVVLRTFQLVSTKPKPAKYRDVYFDIYLVKIPFSSRYFGNYMRWRVYDFSYSKGETYTLKERMKLLVDAFEERTNPKH